MSEQADYIERVEHAGDLLAIIVRHGYSRPGVSFFTPDDLSQQLAYMRHPSGTIIEPHVHRPVARTVSYTQETLILRRGRLRVDFFTSSEVFLESRELVEGDVILLVTGGHGFEVLDEIEMIEVKQGPYAGDNDKVRFIPKSASEPTTGERSADK